MAENHPGKGNSKYEVSEASRAEKGSRRLGRRCNANVEKPLEGLSSKMVSPNLHLKKSHSHSYVNNRLKGREYRKSRKLLL